MARNLRVARIDDRAGGVVHLMDYDPVNGDGVVRLPLELITFPVGERLCLGISRLESAEAFWTAFDPARLPDIVLGDVDFGMGHDVSA